jgi:AraC-like DNA-binding protein
MRGCYDVPCVTKVTTLRPSNHDRSSGTHTHSSGCDDRVAPDALSQVLQDLRLTGASYCRTEMFAPWGIEIPADEGAFFHFMVEGSCWLRSQSAKPLRLEQGDVVLLPRGSGHVLVDSPGSATRRLQELPRVHLGEHTFSLRGAGSGTRYLLVCCGTSFEASALHPLLWMMPHVLHVPSGGRDDRALSALLEIMASEVREQRMGAATLMARLADIIVTRVVRAWVEREAESATGWLAAIRDPQIGASLAAFHRSPERAWDVEALAAAAHLSRSQFSERFTASLGVAPARYVASWRMHLAARWLASERLSIGEVASRLGYESEPSFSRAFKRIVGKPPSGLRRSGYSA